MIHCTECKNIRVICRTRYLWNTSHRNCWLGIGDIKDIFVNNRQGMSRRNETMVQYLVRYCVNSTDKRTDNSG